MGQYEESKPRPLCYEVSDTVGMCRTFHKRGLKTSRLSTLQIPLPQLYSALPIELGIGRNKILAHFQLQYSYAILTQKCAAWVHNNAVECQYLSQGQLRTTFSKKQFPSVCVLNSHYTLAFLRAHLVNQLLCSAVERNTTPRERIFLFLWLSEQLSCSLVGFFWTRLMPNKLLNHSTCPQQVWSIRTVNRHHNSS